MDLTRIDDVKAALRLAGIRPNKSLGQHFLVDRASLQAVIAAAAPSPSDTVLEVGPGLGVMTTELLAQAGQVIAVETDAVLAGLLRRDAPAHLSVVEQDILTFDFASLPAGYVVAANIPYYLTSKLIRLLVEASNPPRVMSLLVQKEVAERVAARPGSMSVLSVAVQFYGRPSIEAQVPRDRFWPAPDVDSAVLKIVYTGPVFPADTSKFFRLVKAGFGERRKQLKNSLSGGLHLSVPAAMALIEAAQLPQTARAQELSLDNWRTLYDAAITAAAV